MFFSSYLSASSFSSVCVVTKKRNGTDKFLDNKRTTKIGVK